MSFLHLAIMADRSLSCFTVRNTFVVIANNLFMSQVYSQILYLNRSLPIVFSTRMNHGFQHLSY